MDQEYVKFVGVQFKLQGATLANPTDRHFVSK